MRYGLYHSVFILDITEMMSDLHLLKPQNRTAKPFCEGTKSCPVGNIGGVVGLSAPPVRCCKGVLASFAS